MLVSDNERLTDKTSKFKPNMIDRNKVEAFGIL